MVPLRCHGNAAQGQANSVRCRCLAKAGNSRVDIVLQPMGVRTAVKASAMLVRMPPRSAGASCKAMGYSVPPSDTRTF